MNKVLDKKLLKKEISKMMTAFGNEYGLNPKRDIFFKEVLPIFAEKLFSETNLTANRLEKIAYQFVEEYRDVRRLGGYNATYGRLYNWFLEFAESLLGFDLMTFYYNPILESNKK